MKTIKIIGIEKPEDIDKMPKFEELFPFLAKQIKEEKLNKIK
jgi:hypothetical protein